MIKESGFYLVASISTPQIRFLYLRIESGNMKTLLQFLAIILIMFNIGCAKKPGYAINIPKKYKGWIYVLKSTDVKRAAVYSPNKMGIVYVPSDVFDKSSFSINVDGKAADRSVNLYEESDSYTTDGRTLKYIKFYYPFNNGKEKENLYYLGNEPVTQFAALYSTPYIDKNRIVLEKDVQ